MVVFTQTVNALSGGLEWSVQDDDYDYHQEIARSSFADMLHDTERNQKYNLALQRAIQLMHDQGRPAHVLDIGTGTGLLSIMAVKAGADSVTACEAFQPMADCAVKIIEDNNCKGKICVIPKRSTDLTVGPQGDLTQRANILVTEVFDTELIGEGALETFSHAQRELLEAECVVVPHAATIYAQVVECPTLQRWNKPMDLADDDGDILVKTPSEITRCAGSAAVHDIQLSQLPPAAFTCVLPPVPVLHYLWAGGPSLSKDRSSSHTGRAEVTGQAQMVFMWWDLQMDTQGDIILSCAPWWAHPDADPALQHPQDSIPWRDHWMQAVYYFPQPVGVTRGEDITLVSSQDEFSLWFSLQRGQQTSAAPISRPVCECGVHINYSRTHVAYLNDRSRNKKHLRALQSAVTPNTVCLCLNGASLMGIAAAKMGAQQVIYLESGIISKRILNTYSTFNGVQSKIKIFESVGDLMKADIVKDVTLIFCDPNFLTALVPWGNLRHGHIVSKLKPQLRSDVVIMPCKFSLWAMPVEFLDLHKIKAPLGTCENINLTIFDELIENSRCASDDELEAQPLWEYPCYCRSEPVKIMDVDLTALQDESSKSQGERPLKGGGSYNGIALWVEWEVDGQTCNTVSCGPLLTPQINTRVSWDPHTRQGVKLLGEAKTFRDGSFLKYVIRSHLAEGLLDFDVSILDDSPDLPQTS